MFPQAPSAVVMIRPHHFLPNEETRADNSFQSQDQQFDGGISQQAYEQVSRVAELLEEAGVRVHLFEDLARIRPTQYFLTTGFRRTPGDKLPFTLCMRKIVAGSVAQTL